jgi:hypothetical protein
MPKRTTKRTTKDKSTSWYKKKADKVFSDFIRQRDGGVCITCGNRKDWKYQQAGHYHSRSCVALRYNEKNVNCQCVACNVFKGGNYPIYAIKMIEKYGDNILYELDEILKESKKNIGKYGKDFYKGIIKKYRI